jgi:hypothetical protein
MLLEFLSLPLVRFRVTNSSFHHSPVVGKMVVWRGQPRALHPATWLCGRAPRDVTPQPRRANPGSCAPPRVTQAPLRTVACRSANGLVCYRQPPTHFTTLPSTLLPRLASLRSGPASEVATTPKTIARAKIARFMGYPVQRESVSRTIPHLAGQNQGFRPLLLPLTRSLLACVIAA